MAPSSDQNSMTSTPTDPDLHFTPSHLGSPSHLPYNPMQMQLSPPHDQSFPMENLEQLWSRLSIENTNNENMSYVRIPVHPRATIARKQMTQTPSLPLHLEPPTQISLGGRTKGMSEFDAQCILTKPHWYIKWYHQSNRGMPKRP